LSVHGPRSWFIEQKGVSYLVKGVAYSTFAFMWCFHCQAWFYSWNLKSSAYCRKSRPRW